MSSSPLYAIKDSLEHFTPVSGNNWIKQEMTPAMKHTCSTGLKAPIWKVRHGNIFQICQKIREERDKGCFKD